MADRFNLGDLRAAIESVNRQVMDERNGEAPNALVLARLKEERASLVAHFSPKLIEMALTKLLNDVCRQSAVGGGLSQQCDLFYGYRRIPKRVTIARGLKKNTVKLRIWEAEEWLHSHSARIVNNDHEGFRRLVEVCRAHARTPDETLEDVLARVRAPIEASRTLDLTVA